MLYGLLDTPAQFTSSKVKGLLRHDFKQRMEADIKIRSYLHQ